MPFISESRFRVRYAETDQMNTAYYANYLVWMEVGRTDYCRDCGFSYGDLEREAQAFLPVAEATCRYLAPARYDDDILVETEIARLNKRIIEFAYKIKRNSSLLAEGRTVHVVIGVDGKPRSLPDNYFQLLKSRK
jgi:acyl-CoA thioester hydrolase